MRGMDNWATKELGLVIVIGYNYISMIYEDLISFQESPSVYKIYLFWGEGNL